MDRSGPTPIRVFETGAILVYLAEKFGAFLHRRMPPACAECLPVMAVLADGQPRRIWAAGFGHFYAYAPTKIEYAIDRFTMETKRQLDVLDRRLAEGPEGYLGGADYYYRRYRGVAVVWRSGKKGLLYGGGEFAFQVQDYKHVQRWTDQIAARPAVKRGRMVNRLQGEPASQLHERHDASDFDTKTQDKIAPAT